MWEVYAVTRWTQWKRRVQERYFAGRKGGWKLREHSGSNIFASFLGSCHLGEDAKFLLSWYGGGVRRMLPNRCIDQEI